MFEGNKDIIKETQRQNDFTGDFEANLSDPKYIFLPSLQLNLIHNYEEFSEQNFNITEDRAKNPYIID